MPEVDTVEESSFGKKTAEPIKFAVVFKAHFWDEFVQNQFERLRARSTGGDVFVLVDETNGEIAGINHSHVIRISERVSEDEGYFQFPKGNSFWYNSDYQLYHFADIFPEYKYFVICEYDCTIKADILPIISCMEDQGLSFVGERIKTPPESWHWRKTAEPYYEDCPDFAGRLVCFAVFKRTLVIQLQSTRREHKMRLTSGGASTDDLNNVTWPYVEAFIGAEIERLCVAEKPLSEFMKTASYDWWPPSHPDEVDRSVDQEIFHPVLAGDRFINSLLRYPDRIPPDTWLDPNSLLRKRLNNERHATIAPLLIEAFKKARNINAIAGLWLEFRELGWKEYSFSLVETLLDIVPPTPTSNIALGKACTQSSVSQWSRSQIPQKDAANAVNGRIAGDYAFHTESEPNPWWMVDLGAIALISEIVLFNRPPPHADRANDLSVWGSENGRLWTLLHNYSSSVPFGGMDGNPLRITFSDHVPVRLVRIELNGTGMLHLAQVQVFGVELTPTKIPGGDTPSIPNVGDGPRLQRGPSKAALEALNVFIINLRQDDEKYAIITAALRKYDFVRQRRIDAVPGSTLPDQLTVSVTGHGPMVRNKGALGCTLSHVRAWEIFLAGSNEWALILEDDAIINDWSDLLSINLPENFDIIFANDRTELPELPPSGRVFTRLNESLRRIEERRQSIGTDCYFISRSGAEKLLLAFNQDGYGFHLDWRILAYSVHIDDANKELPDSNVAEGILSMSRFTGRLPFLNHYAMSPSLVSHHGEGETSRLREDRLGNHAPLELPVDRSFP